MKKLDIKNIRRRNKIAMIRRRNKHRMEERLAARNTEADFNLLMMVGDEAYQTIQWAWHIKRCIENNFPEGALEGYYEAPGDVTEYLTSEEKVRLLVWDYEREAIQ